MASRSTAKKAPPAGKTRLARHKRKSRSSAKKDLGLPLSELIARITKDIPASEWAKLPRDGALNLDHYLYGAVKQSAE